VNRPQRRRLALSAGLVAAVAAAVRLPGALTYALWGDEIPSARALSQPTLHGLLTQVRLRESSPPAWYVTAWAVHHLGLPLADLRLLSVACSAALAALTVVLASRLVPLWSATLAGLLVALGLQFVIHGRELRAYALLMVLVVLFAHLLVRAAAKPTGNRLLALAACVSVGALTHYFFFFTLLCGAFWLWLSPATRQGRACVSAALAVGLLPFATWLPGLRGQLMSGHTEWIGGFDLIKIAYLPSSFFADVGLLYHQAARPSHAPAELVLRVGFLALLFVWAIRLARRSALGALCASLAFGPYVLTAVAAALGAQILDVRNLLVTAPFVAIVVAHGISQLPSRVVPAAAASAAALAAVSCVQARHWAPPPYHALAQALVASGWQPDDTIATY
jgi:uncharacterized membrane protein